MIPADLSQAHAHARKAARETQLDKWIEAAEEHEHAAVNFAKASKSTADTEGLRILRLLEEQHIRLARTSRAQPDKPKPSGQKSTSTTSPPSRSPALAQEMASRRGIPNASQNASQNPPTRGTKAKTQTQEEMELENLTLKQTLEGLVGNIKMLEDDNAKYDKQLRKYVTRWENLRKSAHEKEKEKLKQERAAAKESAPPAGE